MSTYDCNIVELRARISDEGGGSTGPYALVYGYHKQAPSEGVGSGHAVEIQTNPS